MGKKLEKVLSSPNIRRSAEADTVPTGFEAVHVKVPRSLTSTAVNMSSDITAPLGSVSLSLIVILGSWILLLPASLVYSHTMVAGGTALTMQVNLATDVEVVLDRTELLVTTKFSSIGGATNMDGAEIVEHITSLVPV